MASSKIPDWVTAEIFEDLLKANVDGYSKIKNFKADIGSAAGENYATIMLRVKIEVELQGKLLRLMSKKTVSFANLRWQIEIGILHG